MEKVQKQVCDIRAGKRMTIAQSNEHLRVGDLSAFNANRAGNLDPTRTRLNFEIGKGGVVKEVDQKTSITKRIKAILDNYGIKDPNIGLDDDELKKKRVGVRTHANIILQGSRETMRKLAFGDQQVDYEHGADNTHVTRSPEIEKWATDMYKFMSRKYGEENIAAFVVHLDETNPHIHCTLVPITKSGKLSWVDFFNAKKKYDYSKHLDQLHTELAEVNEKWGLKRGDSVALTGAQHKTYLQWLKEQIAANEGTLKEQQLQLYSINAEIKIAEKKLKSFTTMLDNLKEQKEELQMEITCLEEMRDTGNEEVEQQLKIKQEQLEGIIGKISDREGQLSTVQQQLRDLAIKKHDLQKEYDNQKRQMNKDRGDLLDKTQREVNDTFWEMAAEEMKKDYSAMEAFANKLPAELRTEFNDILDNSFFEDLAERGEQMAACAAALFLGYLDAATNIAHSGGGGGGSTSGWGRDKDEEDEAYRRRCCIMGRMMMRPAGRKLKR